MITEIKGEISMRRYQVLLMVLVLLNISFTIYQTVSHQDHLVNQQIFCETFMHTILHVISFQTLLHV